MSENPMCENLLVGICGSVHALDLHHYLYRFRESFAHHIKVIMTAQATRFINPEILELYTDEKIFVDVWDRSPAVNKAAHIQLTRWADLFVVVPATANTLSKAALGVADDLLSTAIVSFTKPIVFVPVMNGAMWSNKALQRNIATLKEDGHYIVSPEATNVAVGTGEWDQAMGSSPETVLLHVKHVHMKHLQEAYWEEATREPPMTPQEKKVRLRKVPNT